MSQLDSRMVQLCAFQPADRSACLSLFDGNVPDYFLATERAAFSDFLADAVRSEEGDVARFYVVELDGRVVACGGWYLHGEIAGLSWGMVDRSQHGSGLGRFLLQERLRIVRQDGRATLARVRTTSAVKGFFEHLGFKVVRNGLPGVVQEVPLVELTLAL